MRYQSFYPFSQSQTHQTPQHFSMPHNQFSNTPPRQPFGVGNGGMYSAPNQMFGAGNGGGLPSALGRMFGQGNAGMQSAPNRMFGQGNPGLPAGSNRIEQYLQTADRFLSTAQQITPMVKQVAPMVQNIPALWKIYRGFQNMPDATSTATAATAASNVAASVPRPSGVSRPKIFQPPI